MLELGTALLGLGPALFGSNKNMRTAIRRATPISAPKAISHGSPALDFRLRARRDTGFDPMGAWLGNNSISGLSGRTDVACSIDAALTGVATSVSAAAATGMAVVATGVMGSVSGWGVVAFNLVCSCKSYAIFESDRNKQILAWAISFNKS